MGKLNANIVGTAPFGIVVRKVGENTGNRCIGSCNTFPVNFTSDDGNNEYYFIVTDSAGCTVDGRDITGGVSNLNCDVLQPNFEATMYHVTCGENQSYVASKLVLTNIVNATRYKIWYDDPGQFPDCENSSGFINGSTLTITLEYNPLSGYDKPFWLRVYNGIGCNVYKSLSGFSHTPEPCLPPCSLLISVSNPVC